MGGPSAPDDSSLAPVKGRYLTSADSGATVPFNPTRIIQELKRFLSYYAGTPSDLPSDQARFRLFDAATIWDGFTVELSQFIADGDDVVSLGTYRGTYKATGKSFSARYAHAWTVKDGKVVHYDQVMDSAELNKAL